MATCRFVHYEVDLATGTAEQRFELLERMEGEAYVLFFFFGRYSCRGSESAHTIGTVMLAPVEELPAQWISCDIRKFDWTIFRGKVKIVMADPPWDIHMDLPYGTMTDAEMKSLRLDLVQDEGLLFLWVTGRAMELGRECMKVRRGFGTFENRQLAVGIQTSRRDCLGENKSAASDYTDRTNWPLAQPFQGGAFFERGARRP